MLFAIFSNYTEKLFVFMKFTNIFKVRAPVVDSALVFVIQWFKSNKKASEKFKAYFQILQAYSTLFA